MKRKAKRATGKQSISAKGKAGHTGDGGENRDFVNAVKGGKKIPAPKLDRAEWDFSKCPVDELWDCWVWESSRHLVPVLDLVRESRSKTAENTYTGLHATLSDDYKKR